MVSLETFLYLSIWYQNVRRGNNFEQASEIFIQGCEITLVKSQKIYLLLLTVVEIYDFK